LKTLSGKVAFITGGASGIGLSVARSLATAGMRIVIADIDAPALQRAKSGLDSSSAHVLAVELDVTLAESWRAAVDAAQAGFARSPCSATMPAPGRPHRRAGSRSGRWRLPKRSGD